METLNTLALIVVASFAALGLVGGVAGLIRPATLFAKVRSVLGSDMGVAVSAATRATFGAALLFIASRTALPTLCFVVGAVSVAGAIALLIFKTPIRALVERLVTQPTLGRSFALAGALVCGALLYAVIPAA